MCAALPSAARRVSARAPGVCTAPAAGAWPPAAGAGALEESNAEARTFHRRRPELSEKEVSRVVNATLEEISNYLVAGDKVQLIGCVLRGGGGPVQLLGVTHARPTDAGHTARLVCAAAPPC